MANRNDKHRTGATVAIVGGGALLLWLLLRGKGFGGGGGATDAGHGSDAPPTGSKTTTPAGPPSPCRVRIDADRIQLDGVPTDVATLTDRCRAVGSAEIRTTGAAVTGVVAEVVRALQAAGVKVWAAPDVWSAGRTTPARRPQ